MVRDEHTDQCWAHTNVQALVTSMHDFSRRTAVDVIIPLYRDWNRFPLVLDQNHTPKHGPGKAPPILGTIRNTLGKGTCKIKMRTLLRGSHSLLTENTGCLEHTAQLFRLLLPVTRAGEHGAPDPG